MPDTADAVSEFRGRVKGELGRRDLSVSQLAEQIRRDRSTVSQAINQGRFPRVQVLIRQALGL
ncbi:hypothetical protein ASA1KI_20960 [Opitutales bacterium ASA1]|uniref:hypothetical protein n=1 Tax=Congregicoccus parvus TaxID=3081749 RepID=UPI002B322AEA|nr:hypothetical protein ASA1KI_20960 [Opitutales bacterium ASA1]